MIWLFLIVVVLIVVFSLAMSAQRAEEARSREEFSTLAQSRVTAYVDFLKRTAQAPETAGMTDNEIQDFIHRNIREYANEQKGGNVIIGLIGIGGVCAGIVFAVSQQSIEPVLVVGGIAIVVASFIHKSLRKELTK